MPHLLDTRSRTEDLLVASWSLVDEGGIGAVTLRRLAARTGVAPATICHQLGNRERLRRVLALRTADRLLEDVVRRVPTEGVAAWLPADDGLVVLRAWLGWVEAGRADLVLGESVEHARQRERDALRWTVRLVMGAVAGTGAEAGDDTGDDDTGDDDTGDDDTGDDAVLTAEALVSGFQELVARRPGGLDLTTARRLLAKAIGAGPDAGRPGVGRPGLGQAVVAASAAARRSATIRSGSSAE